ncbi:hypothetical protein O185_26985, partial [Photorhabdus temperata J3]
SLFFKELLVIQSFQKEPPKARINIKLDLHTGGAQKKFELPLKLWVMAEFSSVVNLTVQNTLAENGSEENIALTFWQINDFELEQVVRQIPQLRAALFTAGRTGIGQGVVCSCQRLQQVPVFLHTSSVQAT